MAIAKLVLVIGGSFSHFRVRSCTLGRAFPHFGIERFHTLSLGSLHDFTLRVSGYCTMPFHGMPKCKKERPKCENARAQVHGTKVQEDHT